MIDNLTKKVIKYKEGCLPRREILIYLNEIILNYAGYHKCFDNDIKHDFYALIISRLDMILNKYEYKKNISFKTWFTKVLKRNFITYLRLKRYKESKNKAVDFYYNNTNIEEYYIIDSHDNEKINMPGFELLSFNEKAVITYKYGYNLINADMKEIAEVILKKIEKKKEIQYKIEKRHIKGIILQKNILDEYDENKKEKLIQEEKNNKQFKIKLEEDCSKISIYPTNKWVAIQLGLKEGTVSAYLNRIKEKLRKQEGVLFGN